VEEKDEILGFLGHDLVDPLGARLGTIEGFYLDEDETPRWVAVLSGGIERPVPLLGAESVGTELRVQYAKELVVDGPVVDLSASPIWPKAASQHFGVGAPLGPPIRFP
jgi:hypothetical protein